MKKRILLSAIILFTIFAILPNAFALSISTSGSGSLFGDTYSYLFVIDDKGIETDGTFTATLTNTSDSSLSDALIDALAFDLADPDPMLGTCPTCLRIDHISPAWTFSMASGGVEFDYTGDRTTPGTRLAPGDTLTFDMTFLDSTYAALGFEIFTGAEAAAGTGIGGGTDIGLVAVSFQTLGIDGEESDLVASSSFAPVPEPATVLLMGTGLLGLIAFSRKKLLSKK